MGEPAYDACMELLWHPGHPVLFFVDSCLCWKQKYVYYKVKQICFTVRQEIQNTNFVSWWLDAAKKLGGKGRSMCVCQFFVLAGSHILKRKVQSEIWRRIQSNIRRQPGTAPPCVLCGFCLNPTFCISQKHCIVFVRATVCIKYKYETRTHPPQYDKTLLGDWRWSLFCAKLVLKTPTVPFFILSLLGWHAIKCININVKLSC